MAETQPVEALASDERLLALTKRGNKAAFPQLWIRYVASARLFASRLVGPSAADDVVSDAFVTAYRAAVEGKTPPSNFRHYIFATIRDRAVESDGVAAAVSESIPSGDQEADAITRAFFSMDRRHRAALWLGEVEGLSTSEIALKMNERAALAVALKVQAKGQFTQLVEEYNGGPILDQASDPLSAIPSGVTSRGAVTRGINQSPLGVALLRGVVSASPRAWATPGLQQLLGGDDGIIAPSGMPVFGEGSSWDSDPIVYHAPLFAPKVPAAAPTPALAGVTAPPSTEAVPTPTGPPPLVDVAEAAKADFDEPVESKESGNDDSEKVGRLTAGPLGAAGEVAPAGETPVGAAVEGVKPLSIHDWLSSLNEDFEEDSSIGASKASKPAAPQPFVPMKPAQPVVPVKPAESIKSVEPTPPVEPIVPVPAPAPIPAQIPTKAEKPIASAPVVEKAPEKIPVKDEPKDSAEDSGPADADPENIDLGVLSSDDARKDKRSYVIATDEDDEGETQESDDDYWKDDRAKKKGRWGWLKIVLLILVVVAVLLLLAKFAFDADDDSTQSPSATPSQTTAPRPTASASTQASSEPTASASTQASSEPTASASTQAPSEPTTGATTAAPPVGDIRPIIISSVDSGPQNICGPKLAGTATSGDTLTIRTGFGDPIQVEVGADGSWAMESNAQVTNPSVSDYTVLIGGEHSPRIQVNVTHSSAPDAWVSVVGDKVKVSGSGLLAGLTVQYAVDGVDLGVADTGSGSVDTEFTHALSSGDHVLTARYYQEQGGSGPAASYPFTVS